MKLRQHPLDVCFLYEPTQSPNQITVNKIPFEVVDVDVYYAAAKGDPFLVDQVLPGYAVVAIGGSETLVLISLGERPSGGYSLTVKSVEDVEGTMLIVVEENKPQPGSVNTAAMTYPHKVILVKSALEKVKVVDTQANQFRHFK